MIQSFNDRYTRPDHRITIKGNQRLTNQIIHHYSILQKFSKQEHLLMRRKIPESTLPKVNRTQMITAEGLQKLRDEHEHLWRVERPDITAKVSWAASLGDRSENADYHYNKKRLREIDNRIRYLCKCVDNLKVINYHPSQEGKVMFGAWVEIKNEAKNLQNRFRIVGYEELNSRKDYISMDSPMAQALLNKTVGDEVIVKTKLGDFVWRILSIEYQK